jgi:chromosome partitioning protein
LKSRIVAVANQKGGVAKTTTVASTGAALAEAGRKVLLIDLDPQACLTFALGIEADQVQFSIHDVLLGRLGPRMAIMPTPEGPDLLPASIELSGAEMQLANRTGREYVLREALDEVGADYDLVLIDCSPSLGVLTINALTAAQEVLIPMQAETLSHRGVAQLLETVEDVRRYTNRDLRVLGVLPTMFDARTRLSREVIADIEEQYGLPVLPPVARSVRFAEAPGTGRSILSTAGRSKGAQAYRDLAATLMEIR